MSKKKPVAFFLAGCLAWLACQAQASVVIVGSRIIYPAQAQEKSLQLNNRSDHPSLVQAWVDRGNEESSAQTADAPFIATPPVFRMEGHTGQTVRLRFTGEQLPEDRESLFFLNVLEIPPVQADLEGRNQFVVMPRHRLKVFYRPATIAQPLERLPALLALHLASEGTDWLINISNPTGYYATFAEANLLAGGQSAPLQLQNSLPPFSSATWRVARNALAGQPDAVQLRLVTDAGGSLDKRIALKP
ncbi:fimbrial biogenesis chaperone [Pseudomonas sp. Au-Pse12]|uniref:fimbrial biogenesis chaperone n=1 Tax=Pseudomonas sp. Au-Pse12 TaxID=2906459 RepID=UPI001E39F235|nr:molecular chaperone [Pseudomonas sp. Au-Pse12]MCE4056856.1 molecular chaperone [Pseudomonas sp. Au-Pse12]